MQCLCQSESYVDCPCPYSMPFKFVLIENNVEADSITIKSRKNPPTSVYYIKILSSKNTNREPDPSGSILESISKSNSINLSGNGSISNSLPS